MIRLVGANPGLTLFDATGRRTAFCSVRIEDPLDRRRAGTDACALDGVAHELSTVFMPCRTGTVRLGGRVVHGAPRVVEGARPASSPFVAVAEVWSTRP